MRGWWRLLARPRCPSMREHQLFIPFSIIPSNDATMLQHINIRGQQLVPTGHASRRRAASIRPPDRLFHKHRRQLSAPVGGRVGADGPCRAQGRRGVGPCRSHRRRQLAVVSHASNAVLIRMLRAQWVQHDMQTVNGHIVVLLLHLCNALQCSSTCLSATWWAARPGPAAAPTPPCRPPGQSAWRAARQGAPSPCALAAATATA